MECHKGPCKREAGLSRIVVQDYVMSEQRERRCCYDCEDGGGHEPRSAGGLEKLKKALPQSLYKKHSLLDPV